MEDYLQILETEFRKNSNPQIALWQMAYMKNQFEFYGIKTPVRRKIQKPLLIRENLPPNDDLGKIVKILWEKPQREYQYFAQELTEKYIKQFDKRDIILFEFMILHKSWWDTVDYIATKLVGEYFKIYPEQRNISVEKWIHSNNIWLQRTSIFFQLNFGKEIDTGFLSYIICSLSVSNEFFITKAIGWILRQDSKINPDWMLNFTSNTRLNKLSIKEATRLINIPNSDKLPF
ncbi:MAG: DNA alkylation repair protein [Thermoflavifilum aggregans]|nr:DNA alkylation repair protein [Thermoflavifilum aggregans]